MKVLVVGSGGREHSIIKKLAQSELVNSIYAAPGNGGIAEDATCVPMKDDAIDELVAFAQEAAIDWTIVGPEVPLTKGIVDAFQEAELNIFGPNQKAAIIEGSKDFAKAFMHRHQIPTATYVTFTDVTQAKAYIYEKGAPIVIKADGLAAGKGVVVAETTEQAIEAVEHMLIDNKFGAAGAQVVIESFLAGKEFSLMAFVNGENVYPLVPARDHKRAFDQDEGPNTGGMGAFAPVPDLPQHVIDTAIETILKPAAKGMVAEGRPFTGILYGGLIETANGPQVIEFNARLGDPETQVILPLLKNDLLQVIIDVMNDEDPQLSWHKGFAVGTVVASQGYPGSYQKQIALPRLNASSSCYIVHAGTAKNKEDTFVSTGGRVLLVGAVQATISQARTEVYTYLNRVFKHNEEFFYRKDIGEK
ncbi:phosphoribosylamine--glycine ligase [Paraliobacillus ryukyuensis]|uniref:Phosphoribosylamine--glycine ligase n=1 Tax=Paraliobacillus ryukyuensis TaxID=200904 RepID=A0A366DTU5_9BACI|nr:phosphoribosylamine--glycine ligase [Paraliobacillus ryukyuensis]RBO93512.1 phosphoribosylamine--glycine ligase [Paraliobacillus ryukyuensis]